MRLKNDTENFAASFNITPPYQMRVIHSSKLIYPREIYQRGVQRKRVELIAADLTNTLRMSRRSAFATASIMWWMASTPSKRASFVTAAEPCRFSARSTPV